MKELFNDNGAELKASISRLIRIGEVSSINPQKCTARVKFDDYDSIVSYELPVLQRNTLQNKDYQMPDIGESVLCVFLPNGTAAGFIVGSFYGGNDTLPEETENYRTVEFSDGTIIKYDRDAHELTAKIGNTKITANHQEVLVNTANDIILTTGNNVKVNAPAITLNGDVNVTGTLTAKGDVVADDISLIKHTHKETVPQNK